MATIKQKIAFKEVLKGSTITKAMKIAKYADTTASTTGKLTNTKGWNELLEKYLPDKLLAKKHLEGLEAIEEKGQVDYSTRHKYLDSAYKLKGKYAPEKSVNLNIEIDNAPQIKELTEKLNALYRGNGEPSDGGLASSVGNQTQDTE